MVLSRPSPQQADGSYPRAPMVLGMVLTNHVLVGIHTHTQKAVIEASWILYTPSPRKTPQTNFKCVLNLSINK